MDRKLTDEEKDVIKKAVELAMDKIEKRIKSNNNDTDTKVLARKLAFDLPIAFSWKETKDGEEYWRDVQKRLNRIAEEGY